MRCGGDERASPSKPLPSSSMEPGSGTDSKVTWLEVVEGIQFTPPSTDNSVNTSKKLLIWYCPPPRPVMVVCPFEGCVGLSRIMNGPYALLPERFMANSSVWKVPVRFPILLRATATSDPLALKATAGPRFTEIRPSHCPL